MTLNTFQATWMLTLYSDVCNMVGNESYTIFWIPKNYD